MSYFSISTSLFVAILNLLLLLTKSEFSPHLPFRSYRALQSNDNPTTTSSSATYSSNQCSTHAMNIDKQRNQLNDNDGQRQLYHLQTMTSSGKTMKMKAAPQPDDSHGVDSDDTDDHSTSTNNIQVIFTIPYTVSSDTILNQTVFITNAATNQLLAAFSSLCINGSSFIINYSTHQPLPQNVCLYVVLNLSSSTTLREILSCRTISQNASSTDDHGGGDQHTVGPSATFIIAQAVIILFMMFLISLVDTARSKHLVNRFSQRILRIAPSDGHGSSRVQLDNLISSPAERQAVAATDLSTVHNERSQPNVLY